MPKAVATPEQRAEALRLYVEFGPGEAARRTGFRRGTISEWARRREQPATAASDTPRVSVVACRSADRPLTATEQRRARVQAATEASRQSAEAKRAQLADALLDDALRLRSTLWEPATVHHWGQEQAPKGFTGRTVFMEHEIARPTFGDQRSILQALAVAVDKSQLLSGEATERSETTGDAEERRERLAAMVERARLRIA